MASASIRYAYGLTRDERERGHFRRGEGITGRVLATGQLIIVQDIDREPTFLCRTVQRDDLPPGPVSFIAMPVRVAAARTTPRLPDDKLSLPPTSRQLCSSAAPANEASP